MCRVQIRKHRHHKVLSRQPARTVNVWPVRCTTPNGSGKGTIALTLAVSLGASDGVSLLQAKQLQSRGDTSRLLHVCQQRSQQRFPLSDLLSVPIQRFLKYPLLIKV